MRRNKYVTDEDEIKLNRRNKSHLKANAFNDILFTKFLPEKVKCNLFSI